MKIISLQLKFEDEVFTAKHLSGCALLTHWGLLCTILQSAQVKKYTCLHMAGHGGTVSRRTENKKLTKLYRLSRKRSPKRLIVLAETKKWRGTTKKIPTLRNGPASHAHFQLRSSATAFLQGGPKK